MRIHRSYLLNIERIARVELYAKDSRVAILRDGTRLPVSRAGYARLAEAAVGLSRHRSRSQLTQFRFVELTNQLVEIPRTMTPR